LGGIAENNLFIASRIYGWSWLLHPGVLVIALITLAGLFYPVVSARVKRSRAAPDEKTLGPATAPVRVVPVPVRTRIARALFALFMAGIFGYVVYQAKFGFGDWEPRAALFPWAIGLPCLLLGLFVFIQEALRSKRKVKVEEWSLEPQSEIDPAIERRRTVSITGWIVGFFVAIWLVGFTAASALATFLYLKFGAKERWAVAVGLAAVAWLFFYGVFDYGLHMPFPEGSVFEWVPSSLAALPSRR
jgi:hypothetical protein